jgi:HTH-type transcriptional regulator/antitoxin HipB
MMLLRSARDAGELIADARRRLRWSQAELAEKIGVSRQWVSYVERGRTTAEFQLVLQALQALGYDVAVRSKDSLEQRDGGTAEERWRGQTRTPLTSDGRSLGRFPAKRPETNDG